MSSRTAYGALHTEHAARKRHHCAWDCGSPIEPGAAYIRSAMPPRTDVNTGDHWWTMPLHGPTQYDCPTYAGPGEVDPRVEACEDIDAIGPRSTQRRGLSPAPRGARVVTAATPGERL